MNRLATLIAVAACSIFGLVACGDDGISEAELERERTTAAQNARQEAEIKELRRELQEQGQGEAESSTSTSVGDVTPPTEAIGGQIPDDARYCGSAYGAGSASCPFVENVADDFYASGEDGSFVSYSPTTDLVYTVTCNGSEPTVCTAGQAAVIYIP